MLKEALEKIQAEVNAAPDDAYVSAVGGFLMEHIRKTPEHAPLILDKDKTVAGSLQAMKDAASKRQKNGVGVLTDAEGFAIVLKYYGVAVTEPAAPVPSVAPVGLAIAFEDLL